jgi:hypothetical protein
MSATVISARGRRHDSWASFSNITQNLDNHRSEAYDGPAALEMSGRCTFGMVLLNYRSPVTDGVKLDARRQPSRPTPTVPPDTAGVRVASCAAVDSVRQ